MSFDAGSVQASAALDLTQWQRAQAQLQRDVTRMGQALGSLPTAEPKVDLKGIQGKQELAVLRTALEQVAGTSPALEQAFGLLGSGAAVMATAITAGAVAFGALTVASIKSAAGLETTVAAVRTIANIDAATTFRALNEMAVRVGESATSLGKSLYDVFGTLETVTGEQALGLVEGFARGAVAAQTDAASFGQAVLGVLNSYKLETEDAARVQDLFFEAVHLGSGSAKEYQQSLGQLAASGKLAGASLEEVFAFMAVVTQGGVPAAEAFNNLNNVFSKLVDKETIERLRLFGIQTTDLAGKTRAPVEILGELAAKVAELGGADTAEAARLLSTLFPDIQARAGVVALITDFERTKRVLASMPEATGAANRAYEIMAKTAEQNGKRFEQAWTAVLNELGANFLPAITALAQGGVVALQTLRGGLTALGQGIDQDLAAAVAAVQAFGVALGTVGATADTALTQLNAPITTLVRIGQELDRLIPLWLEFWRNATGANLVPVGGGPIAPPTPEQFQERIGAEPGDVGALLGAEVADGTRGALAGVARETADDFLTSIDWGGIGTQLGTLLKEGVLRAGIANVFGPLGGAVVGASDAVQAQLRGEQAALAQSQKDQAAPFEKFTADFRRQGELAAEAFASGYDEGSTDFATGVGAALQDLDPVIQAAIADKAALGQDFGAQLMAAWESGIASQAPELFAALADLKEQVAQNLANVVVPEGNEEAGTAAIDGLIANMEVQLRAQFPGISETMVALLREQVMARAKQVADEGGQEVGGEVAAGIIKGVAGRTAEISESVTKVIQQLRTGGISDKFVLFSTDAGDLGRLDAAKRATEEFGTAIKTLTDRDLAASLQALANHAIATGNDAAFQEVAAQAAAHYAAQLEGQKAAQEADAAAKQATALQTRALEAAQGVLTGRYDEFASAVLPGLTAEQAAYVKQLQALGDHTGAAEFAAAALGLSMGDLQAVIGGTGAGFQDYIAHLQELAKFGDPVVNQNRLLQSSTDEFANGIISSLPPAQAAWLQYVKATGGGSEAIRQFYASIGQDSQAFFDAQAQGGEALAAEMARIKGILQFGDVTTNQNRLIKDSTDSFVQSIISGLPPAEAAFAQYVNATQGGAAVIAQTYEALGLDSGAFFAAQAQGNKALAEELKRLGVIQEFRRTGRLAPASPIAPDAIESFRKATTDANAQLRDAQDQADRARLDAGRSHAEAIKGINAGVSQADAELNKSLADAEQQIKDAQEQAEAARAEAQSKLNEQLGALDGQEARLEGEFARNAAERQRQFVQAVADAREQAGRQLEDLARTFSRAGAQALEAQTSALVSASQAMSNLQRQGVQFANTASQKLEDLRLRELFAGGDAKLLSDLARERNRLQADIGFQETDQQAQREQARQQLQERQVDIETAMWRQLSDISGQMGRVRADFETQLGRMREAVLRDALEAQRRHAEQLEELQKQRDAALQAHLEMLRKIDEQEKAARKRAEEAKKAALKKHEEDLQKAEEARQRADEQYDKAIQKVNESREAAQRRHTEQMSLAEKQYSDSIAQLKGANEQLAQLVAKASGTQHINMGEVVVQETAVDFLAEVTKRAVQRMRAGSVG